MLLVISGLPGVGKTRVAVEVARRTGAVHLSVDAVEEAILGAAAEPSWSTGVAAYEAVRAAAEQNLMLHHNVVVDAVNDSELARETWRRAVAATGTTLAIVVLFIADAAEHRRRLEGRHRQLVHVHEPTWNDVLQRAAQFEPWADEPVRLNADVPLEQLASSIAELLDER